MSQENNFRLMLTTNNKEEKIALFKKEYVVDMGYKHHPLINTKTGYESHIFFDGSKRNVFVELVFDPAFPKRMVDHKTKYTMLKKKFGKPDVSKIKDEDNESIICKFFDTSGCLKATMAIDFADAISWEEAPKTIKKFFKPSTVHNFKSYAAYKESMESDETAPEKKKEQDATTTDYEFDGEEQVTHQQVSKKTHHKLNSGLKFKGKKKAASEKYKALFTDDSDVDNDGGDDTLDPVVLEYDGPDLRDFVFKNDENVETVRKHVRNKSAFSGKESLNDSAVELSSTSSQDGDDRRDSLPQSPKSERKAQATKVKIFVDTDSGGEDLDLSFGSTTLNESSITGDTPVLGGDDNAGFNTAIEVV